MEGSAMKIIFNCELNLTGSDQISMVNFCGRCDGWTFGFRKGRNFL